MKQLMILAAVCAAVVMSCIPGPDRETAEDAPLPAEVITLTPDAPITGVDTPGTARLEPFAEEEAEEETGTPSAEVSPRVLWVSRPPESTGIPVEDDDPRPVLLSPIEKTVAYVSIRNTGDGTLRIERVSSTCGCAVGEPEKSVLAPGEETRAEVTVDPQTVGSLTLDRSIAFHTNDPAAAVIPVSVRGFISPAYEIEPPEIDLGVLEKGEIGEASAIFRSLGDTPLELTSVTPWSGSDGYEVGYDKLPESEWRDPRHPEYRITVRATPEVPVGSLDKRFLMLRTDPALRQRIVVPVDGEVHTFYVLSKPLVFVGPALPGDSVEDVLEVQADRPIELTRVESTLPEVTPSVRYSEDRKTAIIDCSIAPDAAPGFRVGRLELSIAAENEEAVELIQLRIQIRTPQ